VAHYEYWPEEVIELNKELSSGYHKELEEKLQGVDDFIERYATIAAYCEIALDGMYTSDQMLEIVKVMIPRLRELRRRPDDGRPEIIIAA
jgi:transcription elongation factor GreA-like protein